jgi:ElaB/YqjD/DUF883 family membrane-anchored ribosome-binding protein
MEPETVPETLEDTPAVSRDRFRERFDALLPTIQREWPQVARETLEATRGSFDEVVSVIAQQTGRTASGVQAQLLDVLHAAGDRTRDLVDRIGPLEEQLEHLLDELNSSLRPRIEKPVRERPLLAIGVAAAVGLIAGLLLAPGRRSS